MSEENNNELVLKPNIINALLPRFLRHTFWNGFFFLSLYLIYMVLDFYFNFGFNLEMILALIFFTLFFSFIKILKDLVVNLATSYIFYPYSVEMKFDFFIQNSHSASYSHVTDIHVEKTIWDRLCNVGDIVIHTSNDSAHKEGKGALVLKDIKNPEKLQQEINKRIFELSRSQS